MKEKVNLVEEPVTAKVTRTFLVHRSGKVVKVLDEEYFDVTNNQYVNKDSEVEENIEETEAEHFERMLAGQKIKVNLVKPVENIPHEEVVEQVKEEKPVILKETKAKEKAEFVPFATRLAKASKDVKEAYNEVKSELLSFGIKSRISSTGDTFRLHNKTYAKIVIVGKGMKIYFALNPKAYKNTTIPFQDASKMVAHKETPFVFKLTSGLSLRRAVQLVRDAAAVDGLEQGEVVKYNHAKEVK